MKTILFAVLLSLLSFHTTFAQIQDLLSNPNITWVAETELEYDLEPNWIDGNTERTNFFTPNRVYDYRVKKYNFDYCDDAGSLREVILNLVESGRIPAYKTSNDTNQLSKDEIEALFYSTDTINFCFDIDSEKPYGIARIRIDPEDIISYIIKQIWYYDNEKKVISNKVLGITLIQNTPEYNISTNQKGVLFYIAFPEAIDKKYDLNLPEVLLTLETYEYVNAASFKTIKGNLNQTFEHVFFQLPKSKAIQIYSTESGRCCNEYADYEKVFKGSVDSVYTFSGDLLVVENPPLQFTDYSKKYKMIQTWYFDASINQVVSALDAVAPAKDMVDDNGNFLYTYPLFYWCFSKKEKKF